MRQADADEFLVGVADQGAEGGVDVEMDALRTEQREAVLQVLSEAVDETLVRLPAVGLEVGDLLAGALELGAQFLARETPAAGQLVHCHPPCIGGCIE